MDSLNVCVFVLHNKQSMWSWVGARFNTEPKSLNISIDENLNFMLSSTVTLTMTLWFIFAVRCLPWFLWFLIDAWFFCCCSALHWFGKTIGYIGAIDYATWRLRTASRYEKVRFCFEVMTTETRLSLSKHVHCTNIKMWCEHNNT